ncbi:MAG: hypothetical protein ACYDC0_14575, partial [Acidimicrobiales bacterium]
MALSFLYLAFVRLIQLVRLCFREQEELAIEVKGTNTSIAPLSWHGTPVASDHRLCSSPSSTSGSASSSASFG